MQFALNIPLAKVAQTGPESAMEAVRRMTRALESSGISAALTSEHPAPSAEWLRTDPAAHDSIDPLVGLAMVAACSDRPKVFTNVLVLP